MTRPQPEHVDTEDTEDAVKGYDGNGYCIMTYISPYSTKFAESVYFNMRQNNEPL